MNRSLLSSPAIALVLAAACSSSSPTAVGFSVQAPAGLTAGAAGTFTIQAVDSRGKTVSGYRGIVHVITDDAAATVADLSFSAADAGSKTAQITLLTAGGHSVQFSDGALWSLASSSVKVAPAPASACRIAGAPSAAKAGDGLALSITALDAYGNADPTPRTLAVTSTDAAATAPATLALTGASGSVAISLATAGSQTVTVKDSSNAFTCTATIAVSPGSPRLVVTGPAELTPDAAGSLTVKVRDSLGNAIIGYRGTVKITSTDPAAATLVAAYAFTEADAGAHSFSVALNTAGQQSITVADASTAALTATAAVMVSAGQATACAIAAPSTATAGQVLALTLTALDKKGNPSRKYSGTLALTSSDAKASGLGPISFSGATAAGAAQLVTAGAQVITATDASAGFSCQAAVAVSPAAAALSLSLPASVNAGTAAAVTVSVSDAYGNAVAGYTGTVHFTTSDPAVTIAAHAFTSGDAGSYSTTAAFGALGAQSIAASDGTLSATASTVVHGLVYTAPTATAGKVQLIADPASTASAVVLDLVMNTDIFAAFGAGFDLPLDASKVALDSSASITSTSSPFGFFSGSAGLVSKAALPASGPLQGVLATVVSQQNGSTDGSGNAVGNTFLNSIDGLGNPVVLYAVKLKLAPGAAVGKVFDGSGLRGAIRDQEGNDQASSADFAVGTLEVR